MADIKTISESEEMYLVSIARLEDGDRPGPVPLSHLAQALSIQPASVNQMVRQLEEDGWVTYTPYVGVTLTDAGREQSRRILRSHRLWEVFLVENLGLLPARADDLACRIEHIIPEESVERLAQFLGQPATCPDGRPIPQPASSHLLDASLPLVDLQVQQSGSLARVEASGAVRSFLKSEGLVPGAEVTILAIGDQGSRLVALPGGQVVHLSHSIARSLQVQPLAR